MCPRVWWKFLNNIFTVKENCKSFSQHFAFSFTNDERLKKDGVDLLIISGFRSFNEQSNLKDNYKVVYGTGANKFSADQGYSEHQLGTT